jgi:outer membrane lipoprotein-sorting protein
MRTKVGQLTNDREAQRIFSKMKDTYRDMKSFAASGQVLITTVRTDRNTAAQTATETRMDFAGKMMKPDLYLIEWSTRAEGLPEMSPSAAFNDGTGDYLVMDGKKTPRQNHQTEPASATDISMGSNLMVPTMFFGQQWGNIAAVNLVKKPDEKMGGEDCFVLVEEPKSSGTETKVWISKETFILKRCQMIMDPAPGPGVGMTDEDIKEVMKKHAGGDVSDAKVEQFTKAVRQWMATMAEAKMTTVQTFTDVQVNPALGKNDFVPREASK